MGRSAIAVRVMIGVLLVWAAALSPSLASSRMTDQEGKRFMWGGKKIARPAVVLDHPGVVRVFAEDAHVSLSPEALAAAPGPKYLAKTTINVVTRKPMSEQEIDALAAQVRQQAAYFHVVGVRFRLDGSDRGHYGWLLFWDGRETIRTILASEDQLARSTEASSSALLADERLIGTWANADAFPGAFSLTERGGRLWLMQSFADGSGGDQRIRLRIARRGLLVGVYSVGDLGTFKADGSGTDAISVRLLGDRLLVSDNETGSDPWFDGRPTGPIARGVMPAVEPGPGAGSFAPHDFKHLDAALSCIRQAATERPDGAGTALRRCFSRADIARLGVLAQVGAAAHIGCGPSRKQSYRLSRRAQAVIWAALLADEPAHIAARLSYKDRSVARNSAEAVDFCADLTARFGPEGSELAGLIELP